MKGHPSKTHKPAEPTVSHSGHKGGHHTSSTSKPTSKSPTQTQPEGSKEKCNPSPSRSMPPSASESIMKDNIVDYWLVLLAWTTCNYKGNDGRVNPDTREIPDVSSINLVSDAVLWNSLASLIEPNSNGASNVAHFINAYFLDNSTAVTPSVAYGQLVRGPGQLNDSYTGILDFRGVVKVSNAVAILRDVKDRSWSTDYDSKMTLWARAYMLWLVNSESGKKARDAAKYANHSRFTKSIDWIFSAAITARFTMHNWRQFKWWRETKMVLLPP